MRKAILKIWVSIDGYVGASDGSSVLVPPSVVAEVTECQVEVLCNAGTHIMDRVLHDAIGRSRRWRVAILSKKSVGSTERPKTTCLFRAAHDSRSRSIGSV
jgi:hypothetical protein